MFLCRVLDEFSPVSGALAGPVASATWRWGSGGAGAAGLQLPDASRLISFSSSTSVLGMALHPLTILSPSDMSLALGPHSLTDRYQSLQGLDCDLPRSYVELLPNPWSPQMRPYLVIDLIEVMKFK